MYYFWYDNTPTFLIFFNIFLLILNFFNINKNLLFVFTSVSEGGGGGVLFIIMNPVQFPLHEPYFDLTIIKVAHTKITCLHF